MKKSDQDTLDYFTSTSKIYIHSKKFSSIENKLLQYVLPADILIRYLLLDSDMFLAVENMIGKIHDKEKLSEYLKSFIKDDSQRESCIHYITNHKHFKKNFFAGVQKYILNVFKKEGREDNWEDGLDELSSWIGEEGNESADGTHEDIKIPERIKQESKIMEKILNFFITFL